MAYVSSLRPPPARKVKDTTAVARGESLFRSSQTECSSCHGEGGDMPDGVRHDVKSSANGDIKAKFDTPSYDPYGVSRPQ